MSTNLRTSIRRPVTMTMVFLGVVVFGMKSYQELALNLMPDLSYPTLTVRTEYPEAAPEEVENFVSRPLEEALGTVSNLVEIRSISSAGLSEVLLEFAWGTDMDLASLDVREKMDRVFFPEEVSRPSILRYNPALDPILRLGVYGDKDLYQLRRIAEKELKPQLEGLAGVASVKTAGTPGFSGAKSWNGYCVSVSSCARVCGRAASCTTSTESRTHRTPNRTFILIPSSCLTSTEPWTARRS